MNKPEVHGTFVKKDGHTFRTSAYIQWGNSIESIGACLLLNPGSANLKANGEIKADPTIEQLIKLVNAINPPPKVIDGRFHIYNLFNLQDASAKSAIDKFETIVKSKNYDDFIDSKVLISELQTNPWILLGWSLQRNRKWVSLELKKKQWRLLIAESKIPSFGKQDPTSKDFYHPNPLIPTQRPIILKELIDLYAEVKPSTLSNICN